MSRLRWTIRLALPCAIVALALLPQLALAVVKPPQEWFDADPAHPALWESMWPTLNEMEFGERVAVSGPGTLSYDVILSEMGSPAARALPAGPIRYEDHDLNFDGSIDHFDLLELGYEVKTATKSTSIAPPVGENQILILRADFPDQAADYVNYGVSYFNQRFFDEDVSPNQSFRDYFDEVSYGQLDIQGTVAAGGPGGDGWYRAKFNKQYYIDNGSNAGRELVKQIIVDADPDVDYSDFDVDGDGFVDCVMVFYPNAVFGGGLWPHRWSGMNLQLDGVVIDSYFISGYNTGADSWTMEISAHEYGHILGLPDLYDVNGGSNGLGRWSLMAYNYDGSHRPPSVDPWCKCQLGWVTPEVITENVTGKSLPRFQDNPAVLKVWTNGLETDQYFLLANYRQVMTDATRPGQGLMIMHIDETISGGNGDNADHRRKHVDIESARGWQSGGGTVNAQDHLDVTSNGHANDMWFAANKSDFSDTTDVDAMRYNGTIGAPQPPSNTGVRVHNISAPGDSMTMDIVVMSATAPSCVIDSPTSGTLTGDVTVNVTATPTAGRTISRVEFFANGAFLGQDTGAPYSLTFDSRKIYNGSRELKAVAVDDAGEIATDKVTLDVDNAASAAPYTDDFDATDQIREWAVYNEFAPRKWEHFGGSVGGRTNTAGVGSTTNGYFYSEHDAFVSRRFDLSTLSSPVLRFRQRYNVSAGENTIKVFATADHGATFTELSTQSGTNTTWHRRAVDLSPVAGQSVHIVFRFDGSPLFALGGNAGWWIDDVEVKSASAAPQIVSITPGDGSAVSGMVNNITVDATDDEAVARVDFFLNGADYLGSDTTSPFTLNWNSQWVFDGTHEFSATAWDEDGQSVSASVDWTASNTGLATPWTYDFTDNPISADFRVLNPSGNGFWKRRASDGFGGGPGMYMGQSTTYDDQEADSLISPTLDLGAAATPQVSFLHRYDLEAGRDFGRLFVTTNLSTWSELASFSALNQGWASASYSLTPWAGQQVKLAWYLESDGADREEGWYVDEILVGAVPTIISVTPNRIPRGDTPEITITGTSFGAGLPIDNPELRLGGNLLTTTSWSDTQIVFTLPGGAASGPLTVSSRGVTGPPFHLAIILPPPVIGGTDQR